MGNFGNQFSWKQSTVTISEKLFALKANYQENVGQLRIFHQRGKKSNTETFLFA